MVKRKSESDIAALLSHEIRLARNYDSQELSEKRERAINYYYGDMDKDTPPEPSGSKVVSKDVAEVIGWMLPGIMRTFMAAGRIVEYEPETEEDEQTADQASDYVSYVFLRDNDGYRIMYNATHDSLLQGDGVVKAWWDDRPDVQVSEHSGLDEMAFTQLVTEPGVEVTAHTFDPETGTNDVKIKRVKSRGRICIEACKPESILTNADATTLEDARFVAQHDEVTRSDLIEMGFPREKVMKLGDLHDEYESGAEDARSRNSAETDDAKDESQVEVDLYECYVKVDIDGDGIAETVRAYYAGRDDAGELLDWEEWGDDHPFTLIPCEPVPHRIDSVSIADNLMDLQQIKTVLRRNVLNNVYAVAHPVREVEQDSVLNPDALIDMKHGAVLWKKRSTAPILPHEIPFVADKLLAAIQDIDTVIERRTGVSRSTMALDPDALQNQTATAVQKATDAAYSKIELIARNMAELGWKRVFGKVLKLLVKHQDQPRTIRLRDKWVPMDPRYWNADMDCTVNVGLGTGSRDRDMAMLNMVLAAQYQLFMTAVQTGQLMVALEMLPKIVKTLTKQAEAAGIRNGEDYYPDFPPEKLQAIMQQASQPKEDPKIAIEREKAQIDAQAKQASLQMDAQKMQMDTQAKQQQAQNDAALAKLKMESDIVLQREQMVAELGLKERQLVSEMQLKRWQLAEEMKIKRELGYHSASMNAGAKVATSQVKMGGEAG